MIRALVLALVVPIASCTGLIEDGGAAGGDPAAGVGDGPGGCPEAPTDLRLAEAALTADGATRVTLAWSAVEGASGYRIERAPGAGSAWTELGTADAETFADPDARRDAGSYRVVAVADGCGAAASQPIAVHAIAAAAYERPRQSVPGVPFTTTLGGVVRYPTTQTTASPLVLVLHGNHGICRLGGVDDCPTMESTGDVDNQCPLPGSETVPNARGYDYLLETLAAQGFVAVSIDGNAFNCRPDFVLERARLILEHLRLWTAFASTSGAEPLGGTFAGAVDLRHVGLLGHSRGGAAVSLIPAEIVREPIPGVTVASVLALAPSGHAIPRPVETPYLALVPTCDGDVTNLEGIRTWDRVRHAAPDVLRSQIAFVGANHNFFSTEWTTDDNDDAEASGSARSCAAASLVGGSAAAAADAQQGVLELAAGAWFDATLRNAPLPAYFRGEAVAPSAMSAWAGASVDLRASYVGPSRLLVDELKSGVAPTTNLLGLPNDVTGFATSERCAGRSCDQALGVCTADGCNGQVGRCSGEGCDLPFQLWHAEADVSALALEWTDAAARARFTLGGVDLSAGRVLSFRVALADADANAPGLAADLSVRVTDDAGEVASLPLSALARVPRLYPVRPPGDQVSNVRPSKELLQTVRIPASRLRAANPDLDLAHLASLELATDVPDRSAGGLVVTDLLLSK